MQKTAHIFATTWVMIIFATGFAWWAFRFQLRRMFTRATRRPPGEDTHD